MDSWCHMASWSSYQIRKIAGCVCAGNVGNVSPPPTSKETAGSRSRHASRHVRHARAVMHVGIANPRWWGKRSRHSQHMHNPQFYVSGKRPMASWVVVIIRSSNCLSIRRETITGTSAETEMLSVGHFGTYFSDIYIKSAYTLKKSYLDVGHFGQGTMRQHHR